MDPESTEQKQERALRLHNEGKLDAAEALYREVLHEHPGHQTALHLLGVVAHQRGRFREAVTLIQMAIAGGARTAPIHTNCGVAFRALGELEPAARHISWAIALDPEYAPAHFNYAMVLLDQGLPQPAVAHLEIVLQLRPDFPRAHFHLGQIRLEADEPALAAEQLRLALQLEPAHAEAHFLLARALMALGDVQAALHSADAALQLKPAYRDAAYLAAKASFELCRERTALARLNRALELAPAPQDGSVLRAARAQPGLMEAWCAANKQRYTRLARPQWLNLPQLKALPAEELQHFILPKPFALEISLARLRDVRVLPQDLLLLSPDDQLFLEGYVRFPQHYVLREDGAIRHCADDGRLLLALPERRIALERPCVWLGAGSSHFEWVFESLARLWAIEQQPDLHELPLIVQAGLNPRQLELLELLGYGAGRRIEVPRGAVLECRELNAASMVSVGQFISPMAIQHLRRELAARVAPAADAPRRIYLTRKNAGARRLANEAELLPLLEQHGFVAVDALAMSAAEQLALFQRAEFILGADSAAMANLFMAPAHAKVGIIMARGLYQLRHYYVSAPLGHDFTYLVAQPDYASHALLTECDLTLARADLQAFLAAC